MTLPAPHDYPEFYQDLLPKRFMAWVVDLVATLILVVIVLILTVFLTIFILPILWGAIAVAYRTVTISRWGATPGMLLAGIKLRHLNGRRPDAQTAFIHSLIYAFQMAFVVPQIGSVAMMLVTPYRQGLNDWLMGTTIVNRYD